MRILCIPGTDNVCYLYRVLIPLTELRKQYGWDCRVLWNFVGEMIDHFGLPDLIWLQRNCDINLLRYLTKLKKVNPRLRFLYEFDDDIWNLPRQNPGPCPENREAPEWFDLADLVVVSTDELKRMVAVYKDPEKIFVIPNYVPDEWAQLAAKHQPRHRLGQPVIAYLGGHPKWDDLKFLHPVLIDLQKEFPESIFLTAHPNGEIPDWARDLRNAVITGTTGREFIPTISAFEVDVALAPIADNHYNRCKSDLKMLEYGICGFPTVASDVGEYSKHKGLVWVAENKSAPWDKAIRTLLSEILPNQGVALRNYVIEKRLISKGAADWKKAVEAAVA